MIFQLNRLKAMNEDLTKQVLELQDEVVVFLARPCLCPTMPSQV